MAGENAGEAANGDSPKLTNGQQGAQDQAEDATAQDADVYTTLTENGGAGEEEAGPTANEVNETSEASAALLYDGGGIADEWTAEEQSTLEEGLTRFADESTFLVKSIKIANLLANKSVRDVAMRCRWMTTNEIGKKRKEEAQAAGKKNKEKKSHGKTGVANNARQSTTDNDDGISNEAIGGTTGQLLEQNEMLAAQIRANLATCKLQENTESFVRFRDNLFSILNGFIHMPGIMSQMPPLPVTVNNELAESILPRSLQMPPPS